MIAPEAAVDWSDWFAGRVSRMHASEIRELLKLLERPDVVSFAGGIPDPALFPMDAIRASFAEILADPNAGHGVAAVFGERRVRAAAPLDRRLHGAPRRAVRDRQHRDHVGLATGPRLHREAVHASGRYRARRRADVSRRAASLQRLRTALRRALSRRRPPSYHARPRRTADASRSLTWCPTLPTRRAKR